MMLCTKDISAIRSSHIFAFATDTVPGVFARYDDWKSIERISVIKKRHVSKRFMLLLEKVEDITRFSFLNRYQRELIEKFSPGQVSFVVPLREDVVIHPYTYSEYENKRWIGVRVPDFPLAREILTILGPLVQTSLNISNKLPVKSDNEIPLSMKKSIDFIVPFTNHKQMKPSTIIRLFEDHYEIMRQGAVKVD